MILPGPISLLLYVFLVRFFAKIDAVVYSGLKVSNADKSYKHYGPDFGIQKVSFTQRGYIQFLKYTTEVPTLTDYTFCIWVKSNNLTYNHPLLSYSKNEEQRLIRVWVSEKGEDLCLEILNHPIFKVTVNLVENVWYHVCQSWSAKQGSWDLFFNGKLKSSGFVPKLRGVPIDGGGDIVVGQEYTDFDKGLDDGIEGDVFGFNFVLSSTMSPNPIKFSNYPLRRRFDSFKFKPHTHQHPHVFNTDAGYQLISLGGGDRETRLRVSPKARYPRNIFQDMMSLFQAEVQTSHIPVYNKFFTKTPAYNHDLTSRRISNDIAKDNAKPLGLLLVELSFDCGFKKGAPLGGQSVLVSWTKSPVRVFGGAILKNIPPFCRTVHSVTK